MISKGIIGLLIVGLSGVAGSAAYAVSGAGFRPFDSRADNPVGTSDAPYIKYAVGAVNNIDTVHYHSAIADLGESGFTPVGGLYWSTTVSGTMAPTTSGLQCTLTAREIATGVATWTSLPVNVNGYFALKISHHVTNSGYYSFSVKCDLPPGLTSGPTAYIWTATALAASTTN